MTVAHVYTAAFQGIEAREVDVQVHTSPLAGPAGGDGRELWGRGHHRVLKVARTIVELAGSDAVAKPHVAQALSYRRLTHLP